MASFTYRSPTSFDFSRAPLYRKTATLATSQVETATATQDVATTINGNEETRNTAEAGDKIITGARGERYVLKQAKFGGLYEEDPYDASTYISTNVIRAMQLAEPTELTAPWGERQRAGKGSFVAQRVDDVADVYLIEKGAFEMTYALVMERKKT